MLDDATGIMTSCEPGSNVTNRSCDVSSLDAVTTMMSVNLTTPVGVQPYYTTVELVCALIAVVGNLLVILVFIRDLKLRTVTNYYVISLAVADLLVGLIGIPSAIATSMGLPRNFQGCLIMNSVLLLLCTSSIFSLVAVTVDRFWAIIHPMTYPMKMTHRNALITIVGCWVLASFVGLLPSMGWNKGPPEKPGCFFMDVIDLNYLVFIFFATILAPSAFMAVVYALIYKAVRRQVRRMSAQMLPRETEPSRRLNAESKAAKSLAVIVLLFLVSWIPLYTLNTVMCFCEDCAVPKPLIQAAIVMSHFNSAWNPALYAWGMKDFREAFWKLFGCSCAQMKPRATLVLKSDPYR